MRTLLSAYLGRRRSPWHGLTTGSGEPDVLAPRPFLPLPDVERHCLAFSKIIEGRPLAGGVVKEVLDAVAGEDETEALVADEPLDRAVYRCHVVSFNQLSVGYV